MISDISSYQQYSNNLNLSSKELKAYQDKKIRALINHAYRNVPYYKQKLDAIGLDPSDIRNAQDLKKIPITTKADIQFGNIQEHLASNYTDKTYRIRETSGSTGKPLKIFIDYDAIRISECIWLRAFFRNGLRIRDKLVSIGNPKNQPSQKRFFQKFGILPRSYVSIFDKPEDQLRALSIYEPDVIRCWTSCLSVLAYKKDPKYNIHPRMLFTSAELLEKTTRRFLESTFGSELFDHYACEELGLIAWECKQHSGYHVNADSIVLEMLKDSEEVSSGEHGEIVCTHLDNFAMPIIRYKLGDMGVKGDEGCSCGLSFPKIISIDGRNDDFIVAENGQLVSPRTVSDVLEYSTNEFKNILQYRIYQVSRTELKVSLVTSAEFSNKEIIFNQVSREMKKYFGDNTEVQVEQVDSISPDPSGKIMKVISNIKTSLN